MQSSSTVDDTTEAMHLDNPFSALPRVIMVNIVNLLRPAHYMNRYDNRTLITLSSCDKYLQNLICKDLSFLWEDICLWYGRSALTDSQLHSFLERVNAARVTRSLHLQLCSITGLGLIPLMGSRVLETVDLRVGSSTGLDDSVVAGILGSMLPYKLETVKLDGPPRPERLPFAMGDFLVRLSLAKARRAVESNAKCSSCDCFLATALQNTGQVLATPPREVKCTQCNGYSCRPLATITSVCPRIRRCISCDAPFCSECDISCSSCAGSSCTECTAVRLCNRCDEAFCDSCRGVYLCESCEEFVCHACAVLFCENCEDLVCFQCIGREACGNCREILCFCHSCREIGYCKRCDQRFCVVCLDGRSCDKCDANICNQCEAEHQCTRCGRRECWDGVSFRKCDDCEIVLCDECLSECKDCGNWFCPTEPPLQQCDYCVEDICGECKPIHRCLPPVEMSESEGRTSCACRNGTVQHPKGQKFMCCFITK